MSEYHDAVNEKALNMFKGRYEIDLPYCYRDNRLAAPLKSFYTNYLSSAMKAMCEESAAKSYCRSATVDMQGNIGSMRCIDEICDF